jgi:hypothetical protein
MVMDKLDTYPSNFSGWNACNKAQRARAADEAPRQHMSLKEEEDRNGELIRREANNMAS